MTTDQHVIKRNEAPPRLHPQKKKNEAGNPPND